ncbi:Cysteine-rich receptor-like protein kinase 10, partial [Mucuna pruriens]
MSTYDRSSHQCSIWTKNLPTLLEDYDLGCNLSILVKRSDIVPSAEWCEPCGTYIIPYPLSTGENCGDPTYNKFNCNKSTGHVSFMMPGGTSYQVTWIDEDTRMFSIQTDASYSCSSTHQNDTPDFPFNVDDCLPDIGTVKISWLPAPEPPCSNLTHCNNCPHSTCRATIGFGTQTRCHCDSNNYWNNSTMSFTQVLYIPSHNFPKVLFNYNNYKFTNLVLNLKCEMYIYLERPDTNFTPGLANARPENQQHSSRRDMNPKISDFGLAKIIEEKKLKQVQRVGYMAPEYALDGFFQFKQISSLFGLCMFLLLHLWVKYVLAWKLWTENKLVDLMDPSLGETCYENEFIKCGLIGLLCIQDEQGD